MTCATIARWTRRCLLAAAPLALIAASAGNAYATCFPTGEGKKTPIKTQFGPAVTTVGQAADVQGHSDTTLVGLWNSVFLLSDGSFYDESFQQFHADGLENMLSRGLPPSLGNVCVGIWKQAGGRTFKLRHMAWNFDAAGNYTSIFVMEVTIRLDRRGHRFTGTWSANNLDKTSGQPIPAEHVEGTVRGVRITVD
jgi:hypothetical protein